MTESGRIFMCMDFKYGKVLLKLSGEALSKGADGIYNYDVLDDICNQIKTCVQSGVKVAVTVGAGNIWRGLRNGRNFERNKADQMGMLATVINCLALQNTFENLGVPSVVMTQCPMPVFAESYNVRDAKKYMDEGKIIIFGCGTGSPFFSTDTGAVLKAAELGVDAILFAKNIDGVYTADPAKDPGAKKYSHLSYRTILKDKLGAMDLTAAAFCEDNSLTTLCFGLNEEDSIVRAAAGEKIGTMLSSAGDDMLEE